MNKYKTFVFKDYRFDLSAMQLTLRYGLDDEIDFSETYTFNVPSMGAFNQTAFDKACFGLFMMAGISYYKAYLPENIVIEKGSLSSEQAAFFDRVYRNGLGEFYVRNDLGPPASIAFPASGAPGASATPIDDLAGSLVPVGGGKDSLVSVELLRGANQAFSTWNVGHSELLGPLLERIGGEHLAVDRNIDPKLLELNHQGAYNGHVPISAILAFAAVATAILSGKRDIVLSNESSAGEGNLNYHGLAVNHQYSKTLEFERDFQGYIAQNITPSIRYFSLLRPMSELRIAELFTAQWLEKYQGVFTSCNRNFKQGNANPLSWCGECPKCAFVYLVFAPFVPRDQLATLFGANLFLKPELEQAYRELLGIEGHKPFECVGEIRECRQAVLMAQATGNFPELDRFDFPPFEYDYRAMQPDAMPAEYRALLEAL